MPDSRSTFRASWQKQLTVIKRWTLRARSRFCEPVIGFNARTARLPIRRRLSGRRGLQGAVEGWSAESLRSSIKRAQEPRRTTIRITTLCQKKLSGTGSSRPASTRANFATRRYRARRDRSITRWVCRIVLPVVSGRRHRRGNPHGDGKGDMPDMWAEPVQAGKLLRRIPGCVPATRPNHTARTDGILCDAIGSRTTRRLLHRPSDRQA
jgi:hypothetical protein